MELKCSSLTLKLSLAIDVVLIISIELLLLESTKHIQLLLLLLVVLLLLLLFYFIVVVTQCCFQITKQQVQKIFNCKSFFMFFTDT